MADTSDKASSSGEYTSSGSSDEELAAHLPRNSVLMQNRDLSRGLKLEKVEVDEVVQIEYEDVVERVVPAGCLMGYIVGKRIEEADFDVLRRAWKISFQIRRHPSGWIIFKFDKEEQKKDVMTNGPYSSSGFPWIIREVPASTPLTDDCFCFIPAWITMPGLPLEYWCAKALSKITSRLGNPIATDHCTAVQRRNSFARVLIEVDARRPLVREVPIKSPNGTLHTQTVHYEFEPRLCSTCNQVGHSAEKCRSFGKTKVNAQSNGKSHAAASKGSYADAVKGSHAVADVTKAKPVLRPAERTNKVGIREDAVGTSTAELKVGKSALMDGGHPTVMEVGQSSEVHVGTSNAKASSIKISDSLAKQKQTKVIQASSGGDGVVDGIIRDMQKIDYLELHDADVDEEDLASRLKGKSKQNQVTTSHKRRKKKGKK